MSAIIKPFKLEDVRGAPSALGVQGITVTPVKGFGRQKDRTEIHRGAEYAVSCVPKVKIDIVIGYGHQDKIVAAIRGAATMGRIGDGKIFVSPIEHAVRIRIGEVDDAAEPPESSSRSTARCPDAAGRFSGISPWQLLTVGVGTRPKVKPAVDTTVPAVHLEAWQGQTEASRISRSSWRKDVQLGQSVQPNALARQ